MYLFRGSTFTSNCHLKTPKHCYFESLGKNQVDCFNFTHHIYVLFMNLICKLKTNNIYIYIYSKFHIKSVMVCFFKNKHDIEFTLKLK